MWPVSNCRSLIRRVRVSLCRIPLPYIKRAIQMPHQSRDPIGVGVFGRNRMMQNPHSGSQSLNRPWLVWIENAWFSFARKSLTLLQRRVRRHLRSPLLFCKLLQLKFKLRKVYGGNSQNQSLVPNQIRPSMTGLFFANCPNQPGIHLMSFG